MNENTKKGVIAVQLIILLLVSSLVVYINIDKSEDRESADINLDEIEDAIDLADTNFEESDSATEIITEMMQKIDEQMVHDYLEGIVSFGPHPQGTIFQTKIKDLPIEKVARHIYSELERRGLNVEYQHWKEDRILRNFIRPYRLGFYEGDNIIVTIPGTDPRSDKIFIVSSHYDSWPKAPGANDNGAGVAAAMAVAEVMSQYSFKHTIKIVLTAGEEFGLIGADEYAKLAQKNNYNIVGIICTEMFGLAETEQGSKIIKVVEDETSSWIASDIKAAGKKYWDDIQLFVLQNREPRYGGDYMKFLKYGYDSVTIYAYEEDPQRHKPGDTLERLNFDYMAKGARLMLATVAEWAEVNV